MKKFTALLLSLAMAMSLAACGGNTDPTPTPTPETSEPVASQPASGLTDGTYTGVGTGKGGEVKVEVTFAGGKITAVNVAEHQETPGISDPALEKIPQSIVDNQSVKLDAVAGATMTSDAILDAVKSCIEQAGGNVADFEKEVQSAPTAEAMEYEADVVIVGAGGAGLMAAYTASQGGAKVIVLEKAANAYSSNFAQCGGPAGVETKVQEEAGVTVTTQMMYDRMYGYANTTVDAKSLWACINRSGDAINTMLDLGITFKLNEDMYGIGFRSRHQINGKGATRIDPITKAVEDKGGMFLYETPGEHILMEDGVAVGVRGTNADGAPVTVKAKAVMICTGGFQGNEEMLKEHFGDVNVISLGSNNASGDGIKMVLEAGGTLDRNFGVGGNEFAGANSKITEGTFDYSAGFNLSNENLAYWIYGGLLVNMNGDRFINEKLIADFPLALGGEAILRQGKAYAVMGQEYYDAVCSEGIVSYLGDPDDWASKISLRFGTTPKAPEQLQKAIDQGWAIKADTLAEAAEYFGLENLEQTVAAYDEMCAQGQDTEFGKSANFLKAVGEGPYYVFEYEPSAWCTIGGVKADSYLRAVGADGDYIPGLYVGGCEVGSIYCTPYYDGPGSCAMIAVGSGVYAAENMLAYIGK